MPLYALEQVCCSVLQRVAACCSVLQDEAVTAVANAVVRARAGVL